MARKTAKAIEPGFIELRVVANINGVCWEDQCYPVKNGRVVLPAYENFWRPLLDSGTLAPVEDNDA